MLVSGAVFCDGAWWPSVGYIAVVGACIEERAGPVAIGDRAFEILRGNQGSDNQWADVETIITSADIPSHLIKCSAPCLHPAGSVGSKYRRTFEAAMALLASIIAPVCLWTRNINRRVPTPAGLVTISVKPPAQSRRWRSGVLRCPHKCSQLFGDDDVDEWQCTRDCASPAGHRRAHFCRPCGELFHNNLVEARRRDELRRQQEMELWIDEQLREAAERSRNRHH